MSPRLTVKWIVVDAVYCLALNKFRIPRLNYSKSVVLLQILLLWFVDGVLFGGIQVAALSQCPILLLTNSM